MRVMPTNRIRWPRWLALVALALQMATTVATPILHARGEVVQATRELETSHSEQCPRIHTDTDYLTCGTHVFAAPVTRFLAPVLKGRTHRSPHAAGLAATSQSWSKSHPVRAPPIL